MRLAVLLPVDADVVVQKSLAEGFGLTVAEAMWKRRPVVGSRVAVWVAAQVHLMFAAFVLGVPMFAVVCELIGIVGLDVAEVLAEAERQGRDDPPSIPRSYDTVAVSIGAAQSSETARTRSRRMRHRGVAFMFFIRMCLPSSSRLMN